MSQPSETSPARKSAAEQPPAADATLAADETRSVALPRGNPTAEPSFAPAAHAGELGKLGRYRVLKELGRGGMGAVFLAYDEQLQRKVALKIMLPDYAANRDSRDRFLREARAAAMVKNDHVVTIYDVGQEEGIPFIAMDYLLGLPLDQYLKTKGELPLAHALRIGRETALGLAAAHALGLVHRDIKPGNLWLEAPKGRVKLLDFGLARAQSDDIQLTRTGALVGTPAYMSPEQARGEKVDQRTDMFSLGVLLYRMTTSEMPFKGNTTTAILTSLAVDTPAPVRQLKPELPQALETLIAGLLAKDPALRPASAKEVAQKLRSIEQGKAKPDAQQPSEPVEPAPLAISVQTQFAWKGIDVTHARRGRTRQQSPWPAIVAGSVLLVALAAFGVVVWCNRPPNVRPQGHLDTSGDATAMQGGWPGSTSATVDLLAMVDVKRDMVNGRWKVEGGKLICGGETAFQPLQERLQIPYTPPAEYDLTLIVERRRTATAPPEGGGEGGRGFISYLATPHPFVVVLDWDIDGKTIHRLGNLDGKPSYENETTTTGAEFEQGKKVRVEYRVRRGSVTVLLNGKQRIRWVGDLTRLQFDNPLWSVPDKTRLALGVQSGEYQVHEWKLTTVSKSTTDPDRKAAEYVLSVGGEVRGKGAKDIKTVADLPKERFTLTHAYFRDPAKVGGFKLQMRHDQWPKPRNF